VNDEFEGWVTKYALTNGIEKKMLEERGKGMVRVVGSGLREIYHGEGKEWHRDYDSARRRAGAMRHAKVISLRKSLAQIEALTFPESAA